MQQVLFRIPVPWFGSVPLYGFGVMLVVALFTAGFLAIRRGRKEGIAPEGQHLARWMQEKFTRLLFASARKAVDEEISLLVYPGRIKRHVVRDEIDDDRKPGFVGSPGKCGEGVLAAEQLVELVMRHGVRRAFPVFADDFGDAARAFADLPDAHWPDGIEAKLGQSRHFVFGDVIKALTVNARVDFKYSQGSFST